MREGHGEQGDHRHARHERDRDAEQRRQVVDRCTAGTPAAPGVDARGADLAADAVDFAADEGNRPQPLQRVAGLLDGAAGRDDRVAELSQSPHLVPRPDAHHDPHRGPGDDDDRQH
jgi:hypothetical protein